LEIASIYEPIREDLLRVEESLRVVSRVDLPWMSDLLEHTLKDAGKLIRPALTLLAAKSYRYDLEFLLPVATAVELLHTATLVHDDTVDRSSVRRGKPTVSSVWGRDVAVLLGDYLFAASAELVSTAGSLRVMSLFAQTLMAISSGELRHMFTIYDLGQTRQHYYQMIGGKTASLFSSATEAGAIVSQAPDEAMAALRDYGYNMGLAFQIVDDILDFVGDETEMGKPVGSDLIQGTLTLPAILYLERYPEDDCIQRVFEGGGSPEHLPQAVERVSNPAVIEECYAIALGFCSQACKGLEALPDNACRQSLLDLAEYAIERKR
jgi:geranylgeranyl pyrophosphate synthase